MQKIKIFGAILATAIILDLAIVMIGLFQIALENKSGIWLPFWKVQAEWIIKLFT